MSSLFKQVYLVKGQDKSFKGFWKNVHLLFTHTMLPSSKNTEYM